MCCIITVNNCNVTFNYTNKIQFEIEYPYFYHILKFILRNVL